MKQYLCIDLKTFYASVECVERGLDPFKVNLVVADKSRGKGALCLAISPRMKRAGVKKQMSPIWNTKVYAVYDCKATNETLYGIFCKYLWDIFEILQ